MSDIRVFSFTEDELKTFVKQVIHQHNQTGDISGTIGFSVHLAVAFKVASDARFAALMKPAAPKATINMTTAPKAAITGAVAPMVMTVNMSDSELPLTKKGLI